MTEEQKQALDRLLEYNWRDELEDYRERQDDGPDHIFASMVILDNYLNGTDHTPASHLEEGKKPADHEQDPETPEFCTCGRPWNDCTANEEPEFCECGRAWDDCAARDGSEEHLDREGR